MNVVAMSQCLIVAFVASVTLWYVVTPYLVQPHPRIVNDILSNSQLLTILPSSSQLQGDQLLIENWTKWRVYVHQTQRHPSSGKPLVIYGRTGEIVPLKNKAVMNMEWRSEYSIQVENDGDQPSSTELTVSIEAPTLSCRHWGIYNHFDTIVMGRTVQIVPRFLFGLPIDIIETLYGDKNHEEDIVSRLPIVGVFTESPRYDRIIIQAYMNIVTLSVVFLLWANNPPETLMGSSTSAKSKAK